MNIIAGILLFIGISYLGFELDRQYKSRLESLRSIREFVEFCTNEIVHLKTDLSASVQKYNEKFPENRIKEVLQEFSPGVSLSKHKNINDKDLLFLSDFLGKVGNLGSVSLGGFIESHKAELNKHIVFVEGERNTKGKLAKKLMPLLGIAVMIFVL